MNVIISLRYQGRLVNTVFQDVEPDDTGNAHVTIDLDETVRLEIAPEIIDVTEANIACERRPLHALPVNDKRRPPQTGDPES